MARPSRSTTQVAGSDVRTSPPSSPPPVRKPNKKRKRAQGTVADSTESPDKKQKPQSGATDAEHMTDTGVVPDIDDMGSEEDEPIDTNPGPSILDFDAKDLLLVLEAFDPANILDDQFTFEEETTSLRQLLQRSNLPSLRQLHQHILTKVPSLSRFVPENSKVARFYQHAKELVEQIALRTYAPKFDQFFSTTVKTEDVEDAKPSQPSASKSQVKYALQQHLATGDLYTSAASLSPRELKKMVKGETSIVAVTPSTLAPPEAFPLLGSFVKGEPRPNKGPPPPRNNNFIVSQAQFIDYGPYTSFAPSFDSDGGQIGRELLGQVITMREERQRRRKLLAAKQRLLERQSASSSHSIDDSSLIRPPAESPVNENLDLRSLAGEFLPKKDVDALMQGIEDVELQRSVDELLVRNGLALQRLIKLQEERLLGGAAGPPPKAEVDSEEWELAKSLESSLATIVSLRPRSAPSTSSSPSSLVPPPSVLQTLERTFALRNPTLGWKGTLAPARDYAVIDNVTVSGSSAIAAPSTVTAPPPTPSPAPQRPAYAASYGVTSAPTPGAQYYARPYAQTQYYNPYASAPGTPTHQQNYYSPPAAGAGTPYPYTAAPAPGSPYAASPYATPGAAGMSRAIPNLASSMSMPATPYGVQGYTQQHWSSASPYASSMGVGGVGGQPVPALPAHLRRATGTLPSSPLAGRGR